MTNDQIIEMLPRKEKLRQQLKDDEIALKKLQESTVALSHSIEMLDRVTEIFEGVALQGPRWEDAGWHTVELNRRAGRIYKVVGKRGFSGHRSEYGFKGLNEWMHFGWTKASATYAVKVWVAHGRLITLEMAKAATSKSGSKS